MNNFHLKLCASLFLFFNFQLLFGQISVDKSVQITAELDASEEMIHISWLPVKDATSYRISERKGITAWTIIESVDASTTSWTYDPYNKGERIELRVEKFGGETGYGYINCGFEIDVVDQHGKCLLVVESDLLAPLEMEIERWIRDVEGDGWAVDLLEVLTTETPADIREKIRNWSFNLGLQSGAVFLLGDVPVPYSGEIFPDGHTNHIGAWPADVYYAEMDGNWTDRNINVVSASDPRNHNIPGDGKWDQSTIPGNTELQIGRVDMSNLPAFPDDYIELTRQYLDKNHAFRNKKFDVKRRGLIENNFAGFAEGFGQNGWKNFTPMFGADSVRRADYESVLSDNDYMWAYACGAGSYTSIGGVGNTTNLYVDRDIKAVFVMNFGSYFGDWDKNNNILRAALASGTILTNAWAARPNWQFHHMALGSNIGYSAMLTQNNGFTYTSGFGGRSIHVALLGDPSLRMHIVAPTSDLILVEDSGTMRASWTASPDASEGYLVYRRTEGNEHFIRLTQDPIPDTEYTDMCIEENVAYDYQVKAVKLESSGSGTYYNTSVGEIASITPQSGNMPVIDFNVTAFYERVEVQNLSMGGTISHWDFGDGNLSAEENTVHRYDTSGTKIICLTLENECGSFTKCDTIELESSFPETIDYQVKDVNCFGESTGAISVVHSGGVPQLKYEWSTGGVDSVIADLPAKSYQLKYTSIVGLQRFSPSIEVKQPDELKATVSTTPSSGNDGTASADVNGGVPPYTLKWGDGTLDPNNLPSGNYQLTVKDANDCEIVIDFEIKMNTATVYLEDSKLEVFPIPARSQTFIDLEKFDFEILSHHLIDMNGRVINGLVEYTDTHIMSVDMKKIPSGTYQLQLVSSGGAVVVPLIKI
jgi:PKD repeat protein